MSQGLKLAISYLHFMFLLYGFMLQKDDHICIICEAGVVQNHTDIRVASAGEVLS